jgi:hypothetical protein
MSDQSEYSRLRATMHSFRDGREAASKFEDDLARAAQDPSDTRHWGFDTWTGGREARLNIAPFATGTDANGKGVHLYREVAAKDAAQVRFVLTARAYDSPFSIIGVFTGPAVATPEEAMAGILAID